MRGVDDLYNLTLLSADPRVATLRPPLDAARIGSAHLSAYRCFLGDANVTAALVNETVRCATPPFDTSQVAGPHNSSGTALPLEVSINAQHAVGAPAVFVVYGVIDATEAAPLSGPTEGGTLITFGGSGFANGSDYRCRFGDGLVVDESPGEDVTRASFDAHSHTLRCRSPPAATGAGAGAATLHLSLNAQNYVHAAGLSFTYTLPLTPTSLSPTAGPSDGSTLVTIALGTAAGGGVEPTCMFGVEVVPAWRPHGAVPANSSLVCRSPTADAAAVRRTLTLLQPAAPGQRPPAGWLQGDAEVLEDGEGLRLRLTTADLASAGSLVLPPGALNASRVGHRHFHARWAMRLHGGDGGDGVSLSYGFLPPSSLGEQGGGLGLRVAFLTAAKCAGKPRPVGAVGATDCPVLTVHYGRTLLATVSLPAAVRGAVSDFVPVVVEYSWAVCDHTATL